MSVCVCVCAHLWLRSWQVTSLDLLSAGWNHHEPLILSLRSLLIAGLQTGTGSYILWISFASGVPSFSRVTSATVYWHGLSPFSHIHSRSHSGQFFFNSTNFAEHLGVMKKSHSKMCSLRRSALPCFSFPPPPPLGSSHFQALWYLQQLPPWLSGVGWGGTLSTFIYCKYLSKHLS